MTTAGTQQQHPGRRSRRQLERIEQPERLHVEHRCRQRTRRYHDLRARRKIHDRAAVVSGVAASCARAGEPAAAVVKPTQEVKYGDYQANGVMGLAKKTKQNPRKLAETIIEQLEVSDLCEEPEIAGPGSDWSLSLATLEMPWVM